jgi:HSP20 family protein
MSENKKTEPDKAASKKSEIAVSTKKAPAARRPRKSTAIKRATTEDLWEAFDETFERFRNDFETLLFPSSIDRMLSLMPETRVPAVDLENREKDFLLKAEMPGFKKEDIAINVQDDGVEISAVTGWKYSKKEKAYICKERACESFYRYVDLPEKIKVDQVSADLCDGVLELTLPKQEPKQKRKVSIK